MVQYKIYTKGKGYDVKKYWNSDTFEKIHEYLRKLYENDYKKYKATYDMMLVKQYRTIKVDILFVDLWVYCCSYPLMKTHYKKAWTIFRNVFTKEERKQLFGDMHINICQSSQKHNKNNSDANDKELLKLKKENTTLKHELTELHEKYKTSEIELHHKSELLKSIEEERNDIKELLEEIQEERMNKKHEKNFFKHMVEQSNKQTKMFHDMIECIKTPLR